MINFILTPVHVLLTIIYPKAVPLLMASRTFSRLFRKRRHVQDERLLENDMLLNEVVSDQDAVCSLEEDDISLHKSESSCTFTDLDNFPAELHNSSARTSQGESTVDEEPMMKILIRKSSSKNINSFVGIIFALLASTLLSVGALLVKLATSVPSFEFVFIRLTLQAVLSLPAMIFFKDTFFYPWKKSKLLVLRGIIGVTAMSLVVYSIKHMNLADARVIFYTSPIYTAIFGRIFLKESITKFDIVATLLSLIGIVLIARPTFLFGSDSSGSNHVWFPTLLSVLAAVANALTIILVRKVAQQVKTRVVVFYFSFIGSIIGLCAAIISGGMKYPDCGTYDAFYIIVNAFLGYIAQLFSTKALQLEKASVVALVRTVGIAIAFFLQLIFLGIAPTGLSIGGAILVLLCNVVIFIKKYYDQKKSNGESTAHLRAAQEQS